MKRVRSATPVKKKRIRGELEPAEGKTAKTFQEAWLNVEGWKRWLKPVKGRQSCESMEPDSVQVIEYNEELDAMSRMYFSEDPIGQERMATQPILDHSIVEEASPTDLGVRPENEFLLGPHNLYTYQDSLGMTVTSGVVNIKKDQSNLIGISIGGGAPLCPCLYIVQVFDNTPASREGTLQSGDELVGVNGQSVKGKTKVEVAKMIQACKEEVNIKYNKLHADPSQGKSLDIILKKVKHRLVENMSTSTADALGLSRAILCNDTLVKKLQELESTEVMYRGLVDHSKRVMKAFYGLLQVYKAFGDAFAGIGVREPQPRASEAFRAFGDYHRLMEKNGVQTLKTIKPILSDLGTYLNKAIPDTKLTIRKYADAKFEYLSYCLKVKEMDDEEYSYAALQEPLYRVETGNYEYRLILRCRQEARARFARLRSDVLVKLELLDSKHVEDVVRQLHRFASQFAKFYDEAKETLQQNALFPIEMDLARSAFQYNSTNQQIQYEDDDDDELIQDGIEAIEDTPTPLIADLIESSTDSEAQAELLGESLDVLQSGQTPLSNTNQTLLSQPGQTPSLQSSQPLLADLQAGQPQNPVHSLLAQLPGPTPSTPMPGPLLPQEDFASFPDLVGQKPQTEPSNSPATLPIDSLIADLTPLQINNEPAVGTLIGLD